MDNFLKGFDNQDYSGFLNKKHLDYMTVIGKIRGLSINDKINLLGFLRTNNISVIESIENGLINHVNHDNNIVIIPTFNIINEIFRSLFRSGFFDGLINPINFPYDNTSGIGKFESTGKQISFDEISIEMLRNIFEFNKKTDGNISCSDGVCGNIGVEFIKKVNKVLSHNETIH